MLVLALTMFEPDPSGENVFVSLDVSVSARPFCGASNSTVLQRDLLLFLDASESLGRTSSGRAELRGGWGEAEHVRLTLEPRGGLGHVALHVVLREQRPDTDFRVEGTLHVEPQELIDFATAVRAAVLDRKPKSFEIGSQCNLSRRPTRRCSRRGAVRGDGWAWYLGATPIGRGLVVGGGRRAAERLAVGRTTVFVIWLISVLLVGPAILVLPAWLVARRHQQESIWLFFLNVPAIGSWIALGCAGAGPTKSLANVVELPPLSALSVVLCYVQVFVLNRRFPNSLCTTAWLALALAAIGAAVFLTVPTLPEQLASLRNTPPNKALQQTRRLFSSVAVRGSLGATPLGRGLCSAAGAAQLSAQLLASGTLVEFLEDNQISEWAACHSLRTDARFEVHLPELESLHRGTYADGGRSGREASAAADLVDRLGVWDECLVWIRAWGVWPSGEDWPAFYAWRGALGERRSLDTAPGHRFERHERELLLELLKLIMENAWDAHVLCARRGRADEILGHISHDEWYEVRAARSPAPKAAG